MCYTPTEQDIIDTMMSQSNKNALVVEEEDDDSHDIPKIPVSSAIQMLQSTEIFLLQRWRSQRPSENDSEDNQI
ncbi:hypothetical protein OROMI_004892 [Orobanche minor]